MGEKIVRYIAEELHNNQMEETIEMEDDLLGTGILDSLGMMRLIRYVEEEFQIQVAPEEMTIENFMTVSAITEFIKTK